MIKLTIPQAAQARQVDPSTVWRWIKRDGLKATRYGKMWLIDEGDLKWFKPKKRGPK